ncbi:UNVERIFIED_CONTAM: hypothetical protein Slati_1675000 [Sesamum latifolium]|uniref:DUF4283 domain-containing protein n=1 Tax=Sesamum latifolium TaxID=2727402 RepID=A0AAW2WXF6_9LAMI
MVADNFNTNSRTSSAKFNLGAQTTVHSVPNSGADPTAPNHACFYVGNIPIDSSSQAVNYDSIVEGFHRSSRKTLRFVPPEFQNGEILVRPSLTIVEEGAKRWLTTAVGYLLGKNPYFHHLKAFATSTWPVLKSVTATSNGFYFFQFKSIAAMEEVIEGGPWLFQGQPIVLQRWEPGMALQKHAHKEVPIWIRLRHLPMEFWTLEGLSTIASGIGKPLYQDAITHDCLRIDYARVCVMLNYNSTLPKHIIVMQPVPGGGKEISCKIDIEYEWMPQKCITCECLGHNTSACIVNHKPPPSVKVYVQKTRSNATVDPVQVVEPSSAQVVDTCTHELGDGQPSRCASMIKASVWNVRGLNGLDHQQAVVALISEFNLDFVGLVETRVAQSNSARIQGVICSKFTWFLDYLGPGDRIWVGWDASEVHVDILEAHRQIVHCEVHILKLHARCLISVVYGDYDMIPRRELWTHISQFSIPAGDTPWMLLGDFNAVLDSSEVSGDGVDHGQACSEFQ